MTDDTDRDTDRDTDPTRAVPDAQPDDPSDDGVDDAATARPAKAGAASRRRPTPAATAASRARRIGGVRTTGAGDAAEPDDDPAADAPARPAVGLSKRDKAESASPAAARPRPRVAAARSGAASAGNARALKDQAKAAPAGGDTVVTEVPGWIRWLPAAVLSACAVAMIVLVAVTSHGVWWAQRSGTSERDQVLAAAKRCTALANTYSYTTLAADEQRGKACTTGLWATQYASAMDKIVKPAATKLKASQRVQINTAGLESSADNGAQWTVILFGQTTITQSGQSTPRVDPFSAVVRMNRVSGHYLVSKIDLITSPTSNS